MKDVYIVVDIKYEEFSSDGTSRHAPIDEENSTCLNIWNRVSYKLQLLEMSKQMCI